jgi:FkbM family methyltransferase
MAQRFLQPNQAYTLVDVGANAGAWAMRFRRYIQCTYVGFEPDPRAFSALRTAFPQEDIRNLCVGRETNNVNFRLGRETTYSSKYQYDSRLSSQSGDLIHEVQQVRLDDCDFGICPLVIKIDVQGAELEVLQGATATLAKAILVILEVPLFRQTQGHNALADVVGCLADAGFHSCYMCLGGLTLNNNTIPIEHDIIFANTQMIDLLSKIR